MVATVFGLVELIIFFTNLSLISLASAFLGLSNVVPAFAFYKVLIKPTPESKMRFALYYIIALTIGEMGECLILIIAGKIALGILLPGFYWCLTYYFYLCIRSYALKPD